ncbi:MAG TPA: hypothetical protein VGA04_19575 [Streptosporangiaceae bacterium]
MRRDGMAPAAPERLTAMLRAGARGLFVEEAAVELVLRHGYWAGREDFTGRFVREQSGPELAGDQLAAVIDWRGAVEGLERGELACSGSELSVLKIAASLAAGCPVSLRLVLGGFDHVNITLVAGAVLHANGTVGGVVIVPAPPAYPAGVRVVAADGTVLQEGGAGAR